MRTARIMVTVSADDKRWLDDYSHAQRVSLAETVRKAVKLFRAQARARPYHDMLDATKGIWKGRHGDALSHVASLRKEWER